jgi:hypothetical protein
MIALSNLKWKTIPECGAILIIVVLIYSVYAKDARLSRFS